MRITRGSPVVETSAGWIKGRRTKTDLGRKIFSFTGIPYAKPPIGPLRFRRSSPCDPWYGCLDTTGVSEPCIQPNMFFPTSRFRMGSEDCLYLNVYTPTLSQAGQGENENLKPVLIFIHGGAFAVGSNDSRLYGPEILLDQDLVLVCMNYRLGTLGFLSLETERSPGNLGLHDQYLSLLWVQQNIRRFGGNPDNVTLMGESAGAMSALLHTVSPFSSGLFHRVIALSGTPSTVFLRPNRRPVQYALALAERLGCQDKDPDRILDYLQTLSVDRIMKHCTMFMDWDYPIPMPWIPTVDSFCSQPFLPLDFTEAVKSGFGTPVPVLYCFCKDEGLLLTSPFHKEPERIEILRKDWDSWAPLLFLNKEREIHTPEDLTTVRRIKQYYFGNSELDSSDESFEKLKDIHSMSYFVQPLLQDAALLAKHNWPVSIMRLSVPPAFSIIHILRNPILEVVLKLSGKAVGLGYFKKSYGVCHGDDLAFIFPFKVPGFPEFVKTKDQKFARKTLLSVLVNFSESRSPFFGFSEELVGSPDGFVNIEPGEVLNYVKVNESEISEQVRFWEQISQVDRRVSSRKPFAKFYSQTPPYRK